MIYLVELCFLGNEVTLKYAEISDVICNCSWYKFPLSTQKLLPMFLIAAQKPIYIKGYMNVKCTRESVKKVIFLKMYVNSSLNSSSVHLIRFVACR